MWFLCRSQTVTGDPSPQAGGLQQAVPSDWTTPMAGAIIVTGVAMLAGGLAALFRNRNNN